MVLKHNIGFQPNILYRSEESIEPGSGLCSWHTAGNGHQPAVSGSQVLTTHLMDRHSHPFLFINYGTVSSSCFRVRALSEMKLQIDVRMICVPGSVAISDASQCPACPVTVLSVLRNCNQVRTVTFLLDCAVLIVNNLQ